MNTRALILVVILMALMLAGCTQDQQQKGTPEPSSNGQVTATPQETENATEDGTEQPEESPSDVDTLETNISEVENLIKDLEETEEINFTL